MYDPEDLLGMSPPVHEPTAEFTESPTVVQGGLMGFIGAAALICTEINEPIGDINTLRPGSLLGLVGGLTVMCTLGGAGAAYVTQRFKQWQRARQAMSDERADASTATAKEPEWGERVERGAKPDFVNRGLFELRMYMYHNEGK